MELFNIQDEKENRKKIRTVGIDFGTTNSLVSYYENGSAHIISDLHDRELIPSIVVFDKEYHSVAYESVLHPEHITIKSVKRLLGKTPEEVLDSQYTSSYIKKLVVNDNGILKLNIYGKLLTPLDIAIKIFSKLKSQADRFFNESVEMAVVTVPAYFDDTCKFQVKRAAELAGFTVMRIIAEPTAAGYAYQLENCQNGTYMVYDFGGGTFDVSIVNMHEGVIQVLATSGDANLGGDDIDSILCQYIKEKYGIFDITPSENEDLLNVARRLKEALSTQNVVEMSGYTLKLWEFEQVTYDVVSKTIDIAKEVYKSVDSPNLHGVILAGGSSKIQSVRKNILSTFLVPIYDHIPPEKVVACGSAIHADNLINKTGSLLIDVVPLSLGLEVMGGIVDKIIPRNTPIPVSSTRHFTTYANNQTAILLHILQGEREMATDCKSLGVFKLPVQPMPAGHARVSVKFSIDADCLLTVTAVDEITSESIAVNIDPTTNLTREYVTNVVVESIKHASEDYTNKLLSEAICDAKISIDNIKMILKEQDILKNQSIIDTIETSIQELEDLIEKKNDHEKIQELIKQLNTLSSPILEAYYDRKVSSLLSGLSIVDF